MKSMFIKNKKPKKSPGKDPYTQGLNEWNDAIYNITSSRNTLVLISLVSIFLAVIAVTGVVYIGSQSKIQPFIVEVDKHGQTYSYGTIGGSNQYDDRIYKAMVGNFIINTRSVSTDFQVQRDNIFKVYSLAHGTGAQTKLANWFNPGGNGETPFEKAQRGETTVVDVTSIIQISTNSWQVDWTERVYDESSLLLEDKEMRSVLEVITENHEEELSDRDFLNNPLGIYVKDFRWTQKL